VNDTLQRRVDRRELLDSAVDLLLRSSMSASLRNEKGGAMEKLTNVLRATELLRIALQPLRGIRVLCLGYQ
jgi:hypothetical protein